MKNLIKYPIMMLCILMFSSCAEDFLNKYPTKPTTDTFFTGEKSAELALTGIYSCLHQQKPNGIIAYNLPGFATYDAFSGLVLQREINNTLASGTILPDNVDIKSYWISWWHVIQRANTMLYNSDPAMSSLMGQYTGEARVLRAMAYYYLIAMFGDVPFLTAPAKYEEMKPARTSKVQILDFIITELNEAADLLPDWTAPTRGRMDKAAAYGLLSRVALLGGSCNYNNDADHYFDIAAKAAEKVIGKRQLSARFNNLFTSDGQKLPDVRSELIMEIMYADGISASSHYVGFTETSRMFAQTGRHPTMTLFDTYECTDGKRIDESPLYDPKVPQKNRDPRLHWTILSHGDTLTAKFGVNKRKIILNAYVGTAGTPEYQKLQELDYATGNWNWVNNDDVNSSAAWTSWVALGQGYMCAKFSRDSVQDMNKQTLSFPIMRYAEVLLNYAEAKIELGQLDQSVYDAIDLVRLRAGMPGVSADRKGNEDKMRQLVRRERKVELAFEGLMMIDIRRWDIGKLINSQPAYGMPTEANGGFAAAAQVIPVFNQVPAGATGLTAAEFDLNDIATYPDKDIRTHREDTRHWEPRFMLWPIPQTEIQMTGMSQNPGYGDAAAE